MLAAIVLACVMISLAVATAPAQGVEQTTTAPIELNPAAGIAPMTITTAMTTYPPTGKIKSVVWYKNGIKQGKLSFTLEETASGSGIFIPVAHAFASQGDVIQFTIKTYGSGYAMVPTGYYESWLLKASDYTTRTPMVPAIVSSNGDQLIPIVYAFDAGTPYPVTGSLVPGSADIRFLKIYS